jgi:hypothetical protein
MESQLIPEGSGSTCIRIDYFEVCAGDNAAAAELR